MESKYSQKAHVYFDSFSRLWWWDCIWCTPEVYSDTGYVEVFTAHSLATMHVHYEHKENK